MHPVRKQRLIIVAFIVLASSVTVALILMALRENMNLFYPPTKIVSGEAPVEKTIRAGGCVVPGSIQQSDSSLEVSFDVTGGGATFTVVYDGILPDLFGPGEAAVVTGKLKQDGLFRASEVLAKHDENYMPAEVQDVLAEGEEAADENAPDYSKHVGTCKEMDYAA